MNHQTYPVISRTEIIKTISEACHANGMGELADSITFEFNSRFKSRMGDANPTTMKIRLSSVLFPRATTTKQRNTVIHEACHIIAYAKYGYHIGRGHKEGWKACMRAAGEVPKRCHQVPTDTKRKPRVTVNCGCSTGCVVGPTVFKRICMGRRYSCRKCGLTLRCE